jgi:hypothetical protein
MTTLQRGCPECISLIDNPFTKETLTIILSVITWICIVETCRSDILLFLEKITRRLKNYFSRPSQVEDDDLDDLSEDDEPDNEENPEDVAAALEEQEMNSELPPHIKYAAIHVLLDYYEELKNRKGNYTKAELYRVSPAVLKREYMEVTGNDTILQIDW